MVHRRCCNCNDLSENDRKWSTQTHIGDDYYFVDAVVDWLFPVQQQISEMEQKRHGPVNIPKTAIDESSPRQHIELRAHVHQVFYY